ncbi:MAG: NAD(P)H-dependent oxidoreductase [Gemmatimonadales bacterium]
MSGATIQLRAVGLSGSPASQSKSRTLLERALAVLRSGGAAVTSFDLATLPADALLGRARAPELDAALAAVGAAHIVAAATPVYRAAYTGLLKAFFDLMPQDLLQGKVGVPIATGGGPAHSLVVDHALRPLFASVGAATVPTGVYGADAQFKDGAVDPKLLALVDAAAAEALTLARALTAARGPVAR